MSRVRSPNYPALSLPAALDRIRSVHKAEGRNTVAREAIAKAMGFTSLNGASATMLSALTKYGLIESAGDGEARVSELAMSILHPDNKEEERAAILEAAFKPALFADLKEKWPDRRPSDESLKSFLIRRGFSDQATAQVIQFYRDTLDIVEQSADAHPASSQIGKKEQPMIPQTTNALASDVTPSQSLGGKPFVIGFDGSVLTGQLAIRSVRDIERLMRVLQAQKAAFEAMQEDDDGSDQFESVEAWSNNADAPS